MVYVDRMVGRLDELVQYAHVASRLLCGGEDGEAEVLLAYYLRAGEGEENASGAYLLEGFGVELAVSLQGIVEYPAVFGKGGRVEDDEVIVAAHGVEVLEGVFGKCLVACIAGEVQLYVAAGEVYGLCRAVYRVYELCSASHGVEREAACVAEHIEYGTSVRISFEERAVFALVYKEARFLSVQPVDVKLQAVFYGGIFGRLAEEVAVFVVQVGFVWQCRLRLVVYIFYGVAHHLFERFGKGVAGKVHAGAVGLHDGGVPVYVDDESRQVVAFAMYEAVCVVLGAVFEPEALPHAVCGQQALPIEIGVYLYGCK